MRGHGILLSARGAGIDAITAVYSVNRDTVSGWIRHWEDRRFEGLRDRPRCGAPRSITAPERRFIRRLATRYPADRQRVMAAFKTRTGKNVSATTIRRILKGK
jgi:transposase